MGEKTIIGWIRAATTARPTIHIGVWDATAPRSIKEPPLQVRAQDHSDMNACTRLWLLLCCAAPYLLTLAFHFVILEPFVCVHVLQSTSARVAQPSSLIFSVTYIQYVAIAISRASRADWGGTGYAGDYAPANRDIFNDPGKCPTELLLWFHHLPWTHPMPKPANYTPPAAPVAAAADENGRRSRHLLFFQTAS